MEEVQALPLADQEGWLLLHDGRRISGPWLAKGFVWLRLVDS
jgi:hypothetical protein